MYVKVEWVHCTGYDLNFIWGYSDSINSWISSQNPWWSLILNVLILDIIHMHGILFCVSNFKEKKNFREFKRVTITRMKIFWIRSQTHCTRRFYNRWLDRRIYKTEMKFWAVLGRQGCRKKLQTAIIMQLFEMVFSNFCVQKNIFASVLKSYIIDR